jgi:hypothetical protein
MALLRVGRSVVTSQTDCFAVLNVSAGRSAAARGFVAALLSCALVITPVWGASSPSLGTIVFADRAVLGAAPASVGATVFSGDRIGTLQGGTLQVRTGAARLLLSGASVATLAMDDATPAAALAAGSASFSTSNSKAFALHVANAVIRPATEQPTIGQVSVLNLKELVVRCTRGSLIIAVEDDVRVIPEGAAYRIVLDAAQPADPQGPRGAGVKESRSGSTPGWPPVKAAKSKFIWYAIAVTALVTVWAVHEALESPDRP